MKGRRLHRYLAGLSVLSALACGDYTAPTSPLSKKDVSPTVPVGAVYSRWMLISGVWVCTEKCDNDAPSDGKVEHLFVNDSLNIDIQ